MRLTVLPGAFAIARLAPGAEVPAWATRGSFFSITRTVDELSVVCAAQDVPPEVRHEPGWSLVQVEGPIPFSATGVLASLAGPLAAAELSLFAVSTFDTDYLLLPAKDLEAASRALRAAGHEIG